MADRITPEEVARLAAAAGTTGTKWVRPTWPCDPWGDDEAEILAESGETVLASRAAGEGGSIIEAEEAALNLMAAAPQMAALIAEQAAEIARLRAERRD